MAHGLKREVQIRFIKMMDMGYMALLYFVFGIGLSKATDLIFHTNTKQELKEKSTFSLILGIILILWTNMVFFYIARNIMQIIPSPFNGLYGYDHNRLKEVTDTAILGITYLYFQVGLRNYLNELNVRFSLEKDLPSDADFF